MGVHRQAWLEKQLSQLVEMRSKIRSSLGVLGGGAVVSAVLAAVLLLLCPATAGQEVSQEAQASLSGIAERQIRAVRPREKKTKKKQRKNVKNLSKKKNSKK